MSADGDRARTLSSEAMEAIRRKQQSRETSGDV